MSARVGSDPHLLLGWRRGLAVATVLLLTGGCTGTAGPTSGDGPHGDDTERVGPAPDLELEAPPVPPPWSAPPGRETPERTPAACDPSRDGSIGAVVSTQLDAFAASDLARAYAMTSPFFRRIIDAVAFETLIRTEFPELVGNDGHRFAECLVRGRRGSLVVGVRAGTQEVVLRYDLSEEPDGWRIDGARRLPDGTLPPQPLA